MSRLIWATVIVAVIGTIATWMLIPRGVPVETALAEKKTIREYVEERAKTRLPSIQRITMPLQGRILPIVLKEGDTVQVGQIVAQMDTSDLETDLVERQNTVKGYDKNIETLVLAILQAEQTVQASKAKYDFAERTFARTKQLADQSAASILKLERDELLMTEASVDLRKDQLTKSMYTLGKSVLQLFRETDLAKESKARRDRERAEIRTPIGGVVLSKEVSSESVLQPGALLMEIGDLAQLQVEADVLTQDVERIQVGNRVEMESRGFSATSLAGVVSRIYPQGFTKMSSLGVEEQRIKIIIDFAPDVLAQLKSQGRTLGVDFQLRVKVFTDEKQDAVTIPRSVLFRDSDGAWQAFVVRSGKATLANVEVGLGNDFEVEVLSGIEESERVILAPDVELQAGQTVTEAVWK